jgi:hypothetical protein
LGWLLVKIIITLNELCFGWRLEKNQGNTQTKLSLVELIELLVMNQDTTQTKNLKMYDNKIAVK